MSSDILCMILSIRLFSGNSYLSVTKPMTWRKDSNSLFNGGIMTAELYARRQAIYRDDATA